MDELALELINAVKSIAPEVWKVLLKQALVEGWQFALATLTGAILTSAHGISLRKMWKKYGEGMWDEFWEIHALIGFAGAITFLVGLSGAFGRFYNPGYYAIKVFLNTL